jgi:pimeloyl-ACP methyl ester carboxylesterase
VKHLTKIIVWLTVIALSGYAAVCALLFAMQGSFLYHPTMPLAGDTTSNITLQRSDANLVVSTRLGTGNNAILYFGGNGEQAAASIPLLSSAFPNASIYALHYRSYSGSTGKPTERNLVGDGEALFDAIYREHKHITVIGRSLGSGVAIQVASHRPIERLVLVTPYNSILELAAERFSFVPMCLLLQDKYESWQFAAGISVPTTVIAAEHDGVIPMASTKRLLTHFKPGVASFIVIPGKGHNDISGSQEYVPALIRVHG